MKQTAPLTTCEASADAEKADLLSEKADLPCVGDDVSQERRRRRSRMFKVAGIASLIFLSGHALLTSYPAWLISLPDLGRSTSALQDLAFGVQDGYVSAYFHKHHGGRGHGFPKPDQLEAAFLKVPSNDSALAASRRHAVSAFESCGH